MRLAQLRKLVENAGCTIEVESLSPGFETLIQAPCGSCFNDGMHEIVIRYYSDRSAMYAEAAHQLAECLPLDECETDCEWCYDPPEPSDA